MSYGCLQWQSETGSLLLPFTLGCKALALALGRPHS